MPPGLALGVLERASRSDCHQCDIAELIRLDASLCGKLLRTVNSALYGLPQKVASIDRALALLGDKAIRSLVLSFSLPAVKGQTRPSPETRDYWKLSVAGAILAQAIAVRMGRASPEEAYLFFSRWPPNRITRFSVSPSRCWLTTNVNWRRKLSALTMPRLPQSFFPNGTCRRKSPRRSGITIIPKKLRGKPKSSASALETYVSPR